MKTVFVGVVISKEWFAAAIFADVQTPITDVFQVENSLKGIGNAD